MFCWCCHHTGGGAARPSGTTGKTATVTEGRTKRVVLLVDSVRVAIQHVGMRCGFLFGFVIDLLLLLILNNSVSERVNDCIE